MTIYIIAPPGHQVCGIIKMLQNYGLQVICKTNNLMANLILLEKADFVYVTSGYASDYDSWTEFHFAIARNRNVCFDMMDIVDDAPISCGEQLMMPEVRQLGWD